MPKKGEKATTCRVCGEPRFVHATQRRALCRDHLYEYIYRKKNEHRHKKGVRPIAVLREQQAKDSEARDAAERRAKLLYDFEQCLYALRRLVCVRDEGCKWESYRDRDRARDHFRSRYASDPEFRRGQRIRITARKYGNPASQAQIEPCDRWQRIAAAADGSVTVLWVTQQLDGATSCALCARAFDWSTRWSVPSIDHKTPVSRGGKHTLSNLHVVCVSCNTAKGDRTLDEYASRRRHSARGCEAAA